MIPLRLRANSTRPEPFVMRLNSEERAFDLDQKDERTPFDGELVHVSADSCTYSGPPGDVRLYGVAPEEVDGDVLLALPHGRGAQRLIRAGSPHNTFLVTERCDQLCVMCSQPPKRHHADFLPFFEAAALLAPEGTTIGISGGEPLLFKDDLILMLGRVLARRPDLSFHVLTNAQHVDEDDLDRIGALPRDRVLWGVPLYAPDVRLHDEIVGKQGAYARLIEALAIMGRAGAAIELRTVVMEPNAAFLPELANFVATHLPFVSRWALMQLENIGYGRQNWERLFLDTSVSFEQVAGALNIARARGIEAALFNFPLCTVPQGYRDRAPSTISDWKRRYLVFCEGCSQRDSCGGFFEWYPDDKGFTRLVRL